MQEFFAKTDATDATDATKYSVTRCIINRGTISAPLLNKYLRVHLRGRDALYIIVKCFPIC